MATKKPTGNGVTAIGGESPTNDAESSIVATNKPYTVDISVVGTCPLLFHRWSNEAVAEKAAAKKGSKEKKTDNVESYVYRNDDNEICIPGIYFRASIIDKKKGAARYLSDPRSPRKMACDLFEAGLVVLDELCRINGGVTDWDFLDRRRAVVQNNAVTRERPAFLEGWTADFTLMVTLPDYITPTMLYDVLSNAGRMVGVGDFRPTYGRFQIVKFDIGIA